MKEYLTEKRFFYVKKINKVIDHIEENLDSRLSLKQLAHIAGFSAYHFHRIFKAVTRETLNAYIKRVKMEKICRQITIYTQKSITDIAFDSGYNSSANFSRDYTIFYKISPSQSRVQQLRPYARKHNHTALRLDFLGIKNIPDKKILYIRVATGYDPHVIYGAFRKLSEYYQKHADCFAIEHYLGIAYDDPDFTPLHKCRYDACFSVKNNMHSFEGVVYNEKVLRGGTYALFLFEGKSEDYASAWDRLFKEWIATSQYLPDNRPHLEIYLASDALKKDMCRAHLCLPVRKI